MNATEGWKEAVIAWNVCASIHRTYAKGKDALFTTRQNDFVNSANNARKMLAAAPTPPAQDDEALEVYGTAHVPESEQVGLDSPTVQQIIDAARGAE